MITATFLAIITGLSWAVSGIIISRSARKEIDLFSFSVLYALISAGLSFLLFARWNHFVLDQSLLLLTLILLAGGTCNALAQNLVRKAMEKGNHASIWAMMQTFMLFPFFFGLIIFHESAGLWKCIGIFCMLAGVFLPCLKGFLTIRSWFLPVISGLLVCGLGQIFYLVSSRWDAVSDPALLRPALVCLGNALGWSLLSVLNRHPLQYPRRFILFIVCISAIYAAGMACFFKALDLFSVAEKSSIAVPLTAGTSIAVFTIYSLISLKEKRTAAEIFSSLLILLGLVLAASV